MKAPKNKDASKDVTITQIDNDQKRFDLSKDQKRVFDVVEGTNKNICLTGKPGVGKSVLIRSLVDNGRKTYSLSAPTGLAALNVEGRTLHSLLKLPISDGIISPSYNRFPEDQRVLSNIKYNIQHLIIDEVSMVRADTFDYIDRLMRYAKGNDSPFGGAQIIMIGDFYQLPPIVKGRQDMTDLRLAGYQSPFAYRSKVFENNFEMVELSEVLRQKGDLPFIELLHSSRTGEVYPSQLTTINQQIGHPGDIRINLACKNAIADEINYRELEKIPETSITFHADAYGEWPQNPCDPNLKLKVGAQVMIKMNGADRPDNFKGEFISSVVNGTLGVILDIDEGKPTQLSGLEFDDEVGPRTQSVTVLTEDGQTVKIYRKRWERKIKVEINGRWEEQVVASFTQMPLALAWAISIHKSQGQSFHHVHLDPKGVFAAGQMYVALSRCRTMAGISLASKLETRHIWCNSDVTEFFNNQ